MNTNIQLTTSNCRLMHCVAISLAMAMPVAIRAQSQCDIDPVTGQRVCTRAPATTPGARAPALDLAYHTPAPDPRPSSIDPSPHCRISLSDGTRGSGSLVARNQSVGLVITCAHLFSGEASSVIVSFSQAGQFTARVVQLDRANDLAALAIRRPDVEPLAIDDGEPSPLLTACGFGPEGVFRALQGRVTGQALAVGADHPSITVACAVRPGDSGGALLNTRGQLVGVVWGQRCGQTYATCGRPLCDFFNLACNKVFAIPQNVAKPLIATSPPTSQPPAPPGVSSPSLDLKALADDIDTRLRALDAKKQDRGDYLQHGDLNGYLRTADARQLTAPLAARAEVDTKLTALASRFDSVHSVVESVREHVAEIATTRNGFLGGASFAKVAVGALGLSGPVAAAIVLAGGLIGARAKQRVYASNPRIGVGRKAESTAAGRDSIESDRAIAVDTPPPPQRTVPETHYVPVEQDSFAKAHQWASEHVARKYPGATEVLQTQNSLIKQFLAGK